MQDFGWTMDEVGAINFNDVEFIVDGWKVHPPIGAMVAGGLGIDKKKPRRATKQNIKELAQFFGK